MNTDIEVGFKFEKENLSDLTNEYKLVDSSGYSIPHPVDDPRFPDASELDLFYSIVGNNKIEPTRLSAYAQYSQKFFWNSSKVSSMQEQELPIGVLIMKLYFHQEHRFAIKPDWDTDMLFRLSGGIYYQAPFIKK